MEKGKQLYESCAVYVELMQKHCRANALERRQKNGTNGTNGTVKYSASVLLGLCFSWHITFFKTRVSFHPSGGRRCNSWEARGRWLLPSTAWRSTTHVKTRERASCSYHSTQLLWLSFECFSLGSAGDKWPWENVHRHALNNRLRNKVWGSLVSGMRFSSPYRVMEQR